ncbi:MAG: cytochrome C biogenesis protein [Candidatus Goldbacteria bacterium]|nr:cytochrome C biogenesis protein [Candidatus Goldiibacteriota bacterium]
MIQELFSSLTLALDKAPAIALTASFIWGILSILLSPCHLASIPLIVGFVGSQGDKITVKKAFFLSFLFSMGILITIAVIGVITGLMGKMLGNTGVWGNVFVAVVFIIVGLYLLEIISFPFLNNISQPKFEKRGYIAAFILGLVFGVALGPCTFAYMAPMLAVAFNEASKNLLYSVSLVTLYAAGHCGVIVLAGTFTELVEKYLRWGKKSKAVIFIKKVCGVLVIAAAIYLLYGAFF